MSLVGPRPLLMEYLPYFTAKERLRFTVRPGITRWAQIRGRNETPWDDRLGFDIWYVENWSLWLDIRILLVTVCQVFTASGVVSDPRSVMLNLDEERSLRG
jgi:sugar transferase EpsL